MKILSINIIMKNIKYLLLVSFCITCCMSFERQIDARNQEWTSLTAANMLFYTELYNKGHGHYPDIENFNNHIFPSNLKSPYLFLKENVRYYKLTDNEYKILIISEYVRLDCDKRTAIKIINQNIYWKDNLAAPGQEIEDIPWDNVNTSITHVIPGENYEGVKEGVKITPFELPPNPCKCSIFSMFE